MLSVLSSLFFSYDADWDPISPDELPAFPIDSPTGSSPLSISEMDEDECFLEDDDTDWADKLSALLADLQERGYDMTGCIGRSSGPVARGGSSLVFRGRVIQGPYMGTSVAIKFLEWTSDLNKVRHAHCSARTWL